jgi:hypothetical protein
MAGGCSGHQFFDRRRWIFVPLQSFTRWWPMDIHHQSCAWVMLLGDSSYGFNNVLRLVRRLEVEMGLCRASSDEQELRQ